MVGRIQREYLSGTKLVTEKRSTWRDSGVNDVVDSVVGAVNARNDFFEREKNLVWKRLNLEAAQIQDEELNSIRTASSINEIPGIVEKFQKSLKDKMSNQTWGPEWMSDLGSGFLAYNQRDVEKAVQAKEKELLTIKMDDALKSYADTIAQAPDDAREVLLGDAYSMIEVQGKGLLTPTEKQKAKENLDGLIKSKRADIIRGQKLAIEKEKLENNQKIADLYVKQIDAKLTREELEAAKVSGIFRYAPEKYVKILEAMNKKDTSSPNDESTVQYIKDNWKDVTEDQLQQWTLDEKINQSTYKFFSGMKSKSNDSANNKNTVDKAEFGKNLLNKARAGEDITADIDEGLATQALTTTQSSRLEEVSQRVRGYSPEYGDAIGKINDGILKTDYQIDGLRLSKNETEDLKNYLKDKNDHDEIIKTQAYGDLGKEILNSNEPVSDEVLKALPEWNSFSLEQQNSLLAGAEKRRKQVFATQKNNISSQIDSGAITTQDQISELVMDYGWGTDRSADVTGLRQLLTAKNSDQYGVYTKALEIVDKQMGSVFSSNEQTALELTMKDKARQWVTATYLKAIDQGKTPEETAELLAPSKIVSFVENVRPSRREILNSQNALMLTTQNLEIERENLMEYDKNSKVWNIKENTSFAEIFDYSNQLDAAFSQNLMDPKTYNEKKSEMSRPLLEALDNFEQSEDGNTLLGDIYRTSIQPFGNGSGLTLQQRANVLMQVAILMKKNNIDFNQKNWGVDAVSDFFIPGSGAQYFDDHTKTKDGQAVQRSLPGFIAQNVIRNLLVEVYPNANVAEVEKVAAGNDLVTMWTPYKNTVPDSFEGFKTPEIGLKDFFNQAMNKFFAEKTENNK